MENATTIRSEIEKELKLGGYTFNSFGQATGLNRGIFSAMLNGNPPKPISVRQMDLITKAFNYPEGWLYDLYVDECFYDGRPHWKRVKPFLIRCVEVGNLRCVEKVLSRLMEDLNHIPTIFALAEELYEGGKLQEAIPFYECVIENEKYQHSERLAISHYKLFVASVGQDLEKNLESVLRFIPYRNRLPESYQLDGLLKIINIYFYLHKWDNVEKYGDELCTLAKTVYLNRYENNNTKRRVKDEFKTEKNLVFYYGYGYLSKSTALQKMEKFEEAQSYIKYYADLSWFKGLNSEGEQYVKMFSLWAKANSYTLDMLLGKRDVLVEYISFLNQHPEEKLSGLLTILESANKYNFSVDYVLESFSAEIDQFKFLDDVKNRNYYCCFLYQRAIYEYKSNSLEKGTNYVLDCLALSLISRNDSDFKQCVALFEVYREFATYEQTKRYENIIKEVNIYEKRLFGGTSLRYSIF
ncbi:DNA-binding protein [Paenibacillus sp. SEL1]